MLLRRSRPLLLLASFIACSGAGCADDAMNIDAIGLDAPLIDETGFSPPGIDPRLLGTFRSDEVALGELMLLALKSNKTFHYGRVVTCLPPQQGSCGPAQADGHYSLSQDEGKKYLELFNERGLLLRYEYDIGGDALRMRQDYSSALWRSMVRSADSWCGVPNDCMFQALGTPDCEGGWTCGRDTCAFECLTYVCGGDSLACTVPSEASRDASAAR